MKHRQQSGAGDSIQRMSYVHSATPTISVALAHSLPEGKHLIAVYSWPLVLEETVANKKNLTHNGRMLTDSD